MNEFQTTLLLLKMALFRIRRGLSKKKYSTESLIFGFRQLQRGKLTWTALRGKHYYVANYA